MDHHILPYTPRTENMMASIVLQHPLVFLLTNPKEFLCSRLANRVHRHLKIADSMIQTNPFVLEQLLGLENRDCSGE